MSTLQICWIFRRISEKHGAVSLLTLLKNIAQLIFPIFQIHGTKKNEESSIVMVYFWNLFECLRVAVSVTLKVIVSAFPTHDNVIKAAGNLADGTLLAEE